MAKAKTRQDSPNVEFKCPRLEARIRKALRRPKRLGAITRKYLASLEHLKAGLISDLTGIEYATRLTELELYCKPLTDLTPLAELKRLTTLHLSTNPITDLSPLAGLKRLTHLELSSNEITDITALADLKRLTELKLGNNSITEITALADLKRLTKLDLNLSSITDITPLADLKRLAELDLSMNKITDITPLAELKQLIELDLGYNKIADITPLADLKRLTNLTLRDNKITDITPLAELKQLTELNLDDNKITDVTPLAELKRLTDLKLGSNKIIDVTPLASLDGRTMRHFDVWNNQISDFTPLVGHKLYKFVGGALNNQRVPREIDCLDIDVQLLQAAADGDVDAVRDLITQEADLRSTDENGATAWELAATAGHNAVVKVLKEAAYDLEELLAHPEMGHSQRVPCPICGVFYNITEPICNHFIGTTYGRDIQPHDLCDGLDGIVLTIAVDVEQYIDQSVNQPPIKSEQKRKGTRKKSSRKEVITQLMQSIPKSLVPAIDNMVNYGDQWWTHASGVKRGVSVTVDEFMNSSIHQDFFHRDVSHFVRIQKDRASKVMRWLEKQGYVPDESDSEL